MDLLSEVPKLSFDFGTSRGTKQKMRLKTVPTTINFRYIRIVFFWVNACHLLKERLFPQMTRFSRNTMLELDPPVQIKIQNCSPSAADVFPCGTGNVNTH